MNSSHFTLFAGERATSPPNFNSGAGYAPAWAQTRRPTALAAEAADFGWFNSPKSERGPL